MRFWGGGTLKVRVGLGRDSHRFVSDESSKPCIIAGMLFEDEAGLASPSDGDVVFHAICNAITSLTGQPIMGEIAATLCNKQGITDSEVYVREALKMLSPQKISHLAVTIEGRRPQFKSKLHQMRQKMAEVLSLSPDQVGLTATTGQGLTDFGCGDGLQVLCLLTTFEM